MLNFVPRLPDPRRQSDALLKQGISGAAAVVRQVNHLRRHVTEPAVRRLGMKTQNLPNDLLARLQFVCMPWRMKFSRRGPQERILARSPDAPVGMGGPYIPRPVGGDRAHRVPQRHVAGDPLVKNVAVLEGIEDQLTVLDVLANAADVLLLRALQLEQDMAVVEKEVEGASSALTFWATRVTRRKSSDHM